MPNKIQNLKDIIRPLASKDKPELMSLIRDIQEFLPEEVPVAEELLDCYLQDGEESGYHIFVAADSKILGYICYGPIPITLGTWDIYWIAVAREARGKDVGKGLISFAEEKIRKAGGKLIMIETSSKPSYEPTRRFYSAAGYEVIATIPDFYSPGDDKILFWKKLM